MHRNRKLAQSTAFAAVLLVAAIYRAGPQTASGRDLANRGGDPIATCDSTGLHDESCTYSGTGDGTLCKSNVYTAAYATSNPEAWLDKLKDPGGGDFTKCKKYVDCSPERHDRLLEQECTKTKGGGPQ